MQDQVEAGEPQVLLVETVQNTMERMDQVVAEAETQRFPGEQLLQDLEEHSEVAVEELESPSLAV